MNIYTKRTFNELLSQYGTCCHSISQFKDTSINFIKSQISNNAILTEIHKAMKHFYQELISVFILIMLSQLME